MRKTVPLVVGVGVLLMAAFAFGSTRHYTGTDKDPGCSNPNADGCVITFDAKVRKGKVKTVNEFVFDRIPIVCNEGTFYVANLEAPVSGMKVNKRRKFSGVLNGPNRQRITVTGRFAKSWKTATGTVEDQGDFPPTASNCTTGVDDWEASR